MAFLLLYVSPSHFLCWFSLCAIFFNPSLSVSVNHTTGRTPWRQAMQSDNDDCAMILRAAYKGNVADMVNSQREQTHFLSHERTKTINKPTS